MKHPYPIPWSRKLHSAHQVPVGEHPVVGRLLLNGESMKAVSCQVKWPFS